MKKNTCLSVLIGLLVSFILVSNSFARDILVGIIDDLSGPAGTYGIRHLRGFELAFEEINKAGGVKGLGKFKWIVEDSATDPSQSVNAANKLIYRDKVDVLMAS